MKNLSLVMLGAALGFGTMALTGGGASAAALLPLSPLASSQQAVASDGIIQVAQGDNMDRRMRHDWNRNRDGKRCSRRNDNCRHFHDGYYYETPWWTLPLIIGGSIAANDYNNYDDDFDGGYDDSGYGDEHVEWCLNRYRSYNLRNNTWVSYSGQVNQCNSPY